MYKSKVALVEIRGDGTIAELSRKYGIHANMIVKWKREALEGMKETFANAKMLVKKLICTTKPQENQR